MNGRLARGEPVTNRMDDGEDVLPSVSVVVATRDRPQLLARTVRGLLDQRYPGEIE